MLSERSLDFPKFDPEAADLDLVIAAAKELDVSVWPVTREVSGLIQPRSRLAAEGIWNKLLAGQIGPPDIASSQTHATDVQVTGDADREKPKQIIQDIYLCVRYRTSDRNCRMGIALFALANR